MVISMGSWHGRGGSKAKRVPVTGVSWVRVGCGVSAAAPVKSFPPMPPPPMSLLHRVSRWYLRHLEEVMRRRSCFLWGPRLQGIHPARRCTARNASSSENATRVETCKIGWVAGYCEVVGGRDDLFFTMLAKNASGSGIAIILASASARRLSSASKSVIKAWRQNKQKQKKNRTIKRRQIRHIHFHVARL